MGGGVAGYNHFGKGFMLRVMIHKKHIKTGTQNKKRCNSGQRPVGGQETTILLGVDGHRKPWNPRGTQRKQ